MCWGRSPEGSVRESRSRKTGRGWLSAGGRPLARSPAPAPLQPDGLLRVWRASATPRPSEGAAKNARPPFSGRDFTVGGAWRQANATSSHLSRRASHYGQARTSAEAVASGPPQARGRARCSKPPLAPFSRLRLVYPRAARLCADKSSDRTLFFSLFSFPSAAQHSPRRPRWIGASGRGFAHSLSERAAAIFLSPVFTRLRLPAGCHCECGTIDSQCAEEARAHARPHCPAFISCSDYVANATILTKPANISYYGNHFNMRVNIPKSQANKYDFSRGISKFYKIRR